MWRSVVALLAFSIAEGSRRGRRLEVENYKNDGGVCTASLQSNKYTTVAKDDDRFNPYCMNKFTPEISIIPSLELESLEIEYTRKVDGWGDVRMRGIELVIITNLVQNNENAIDLAHRAWLKVEPYNRKQETKLKNDETVQRAYQLYDKTGGRQTSPVNYFRISGFDCRLAEHAGKKPEEIWEAPAEKPSDEEVENMQKIFKGIKEECDKLYEENSDNASFSQKNLAKSLYRLRGCGQERELHVLNPEDALDQIEAFMEKHCESDLNDVIDAIVGLPWWAILLIVLSVILLLLLIAFVVYWFCCRKKNTGGAKVQGARDDEYASYYEDEPTAVKIRE